MKAIKIYSLLFLFTMMACIAVRAQHKTTADVPKTTETVKHIEKIVGTWELQRVAGSKSNPERRRQEADARNNGMQIIDFDPEGRYKMQTYNEVVDSGSYRLNEQHGILYLHSDADQQNVTEWKINFKNGQLSLRSREGRGAAALVRYDYTRIREGLSRNQ